MRLIILPINKVRIKNCRSVVVLFRQIVIRKLINIMHARLLLSVSTVYLFRVPVEFKTILNDFSQGYIDLLKTIRADKSVMFYSILFQENKLTFFWPYK